MLKVARRVLEKDKDKELALPNIKTYYEAIIICQSGVDARTNTLTSGTE